MHVHIVNGVLKGCSSVTQDIWIWIQSTKDMYGYGYGYSMAIDMAMAMPGRPLFHNMGMWHVDHDYSFMGIYRDICRFGEYYAELVYTFSFGDIAELFIINVCLDKLHGK
jgi:hypothetical protein